MDPLSSSLETLILSYRGIASLSAVSHLWTWVAILTAAISLWWIKNVGGAASSRRRNEPLQKERPPEKTDGGYLCHLSARLETFPSSIAVRSDTVPASPASESNSGSLDFCMHGDWPEEGYCPSAKISGPFFRRWEDDSECLPGIGRVGCILCEEGRGKFAVYFDGDLRDGGDRCRGAVEESRFRGSGSWIDADDCAVAARDLAPLVGSANEWPWYHHLDLAVLNGNVVRLWEGVSGRKPPVGWASRQVVSLF